MQWKEKLITLGKRPNVFLTTATTGVHHDDQLVGVSALEEGVEDILVPLTLICKVDRDKLLQSMSYHGVTEKRMVEEGESTETMQHFCESLAGKNLFMYNPMFQIRFLKRGSNDAMLPRLFNLPLLLTGAEAQIPVPEDLDLFGIESLFFKRLGAPSSFKAICARHKLTTDNTDVGQLPMEQNCHLLYALWEIWQELPFVPGETE